MQAAAAAAAAAGNTHTVAADTEDHDAHYAPHVDVAAAAAAAAADCDLAPPPQLSALANPHFVAELQNSKPQTPSIHEIREQQNQSVENISSS